MFIPTTDSDSGSEILLRLSEYTLMGLARADNLKLTRKRARVLAPIFREFLAELQEMDELDLGEEPLPLTFGPPREND
jgi:hypothetical protein